MALLVGKWVIEATCPLCFNIWVLDMHEITQNEETGIATFICSECNKQVNTPISQTKACKFWLKRPIEIKDGLFYNN